MFKEIQLSNFRGIKFSGNIPLAPLTVFTGSEGSGKSSVGHFLTMLKQTVMTADSNVVLYPGDIDSNIQLGTQSSLLYKKLEGDLTFSYSFSLPEYLVMEDPEKDRSGVPTQFLYGERIQFHCILSNKGAVHPFVKKFSYDLYDIDERVATATTLRTTLTTKRSEKVQYAVETDAYNLKNKTGRPWLQKSPHHFYGFSDELNTYYKNASGLFTLSQTHEAKLRNIYYVGSDRKRFNALHLWSGLNRFDVGHNGAHTITALLGSGDREISLGDRRRNQSIMEIVDTLLQQMELTHGFKVEELKAIEHGYAVRITSRTSKHSVELTEAGSTVAQVLPILVQCFCAPHNSTIVLDGIETHLSPRGQALLADVLLTVIQSKEDSIDRNIQLIVSTQSEAFLRRLQRRIAEGAVPLDSVLAYHTSNHRRGINIAPIALLTDNTLTDLTPYFTFEDDDRMIDIVVDENLETTPRRDLERPIKFTPKKSAVKAKRGPGRPKGSKNKTTPTTNDDTPKRGRGRPKGSKNKTTPTTNDDTPKRGRGRPKGSKNKTTATTNDDTPKRGRGRPKGSKNKTTATTNEDTPKRGRGRPKGSKNKTTATTNEDTPKRGRGRPKGSKNKTTATTNEDTPKRGRGRPKDSKNKTETLNPKRVQRSTRIPSNSTQKTRANNLKARHADKFNSEKGSPAI